jgi:hypothetical protein
VEAGMQLTHMNFLTTVSLITAFAGGMVVSPCCITFLLPSYLCQYLPGPENILWLTLLFGLGIATVLVPAALRYPSCRTGISKFHTQTYLVGGVFMIILGVMELTGKNYNLMLNLTIDLNAHKNPWAVYVPVFSGITSSCCTPVLAEFNVFSPLSQGPVLPRSLRRRHIVPLVILALLLDRVDWQK